MSRHRKVGRRCVFESLESRELLAGDVSAKIVNGNLMVKGDNDANDIVITAGPAGAVTIVSGANATTVNGAAAASPVTIPGTLTGRIELSMKRGDDSVQLTLAQNITGLKAQMDGDSDTLNVIGGGFTVNGNVGVDMGKGVTDNLNLNGLTVAGKTKLEGDDGTNNFNVGVTTGNTFNDSLEVKLKDGDDGLVMMNSTVTDKTRIKAGKGNDTITLDSTFARLGVSLDKGDDTLSILNSDATATRIKGGKGNDSVTLNASTFASLDLAMGKGDDTLHAMNTHVTGNARLDGGHGTDAIDNLGGNTVGGTLKVKNFETGTFV